MNALLSSYTVVSTLFCFLFSVGAAVLAIHLYSLLRTGQIGASWRVLITASVLYALVQAVKLAEVIGVPYASSLHLSGIIELVFVLALAYAFYLQRQVFTEARRISHEELDVEDEEETTVSPYKHFLE